jgi:flagellar biogenesis protein FliO
LGQDISIAINIVLFGALLFMGFLIWDFRKVMMARLRRLHVALGEAVVELRERRR